MSGSYTHGIPQPRQGGGWRRADTYHSTARDLDGAVDSLFAARADDDSPLFAGRYNPECACCYLGFPHTTEHHNNSVGKGGQQ